MSSTCRRVDEALSAYRDGDVPERARRRVEQHLHGCADCRDRMADMERAMRALERYQPVAPPVGMLGAFHARLAIEKAQARPRRFGIWPGRLALAGVAAAVVAMACLRPAAPPAQEVAVAPPVPVVAGERDAGTRGRGDAEMGRRGDGETRRCVDAPSAVPAGRPARGRVAPVRHAGRGGGTAPAVPGRRQPPARTEKMAPAGMQESIDPVAAPAGVAPAVAEPIVARVEVTAQNVDLMDPYTGETRQMGVTRVVDASTGSMHITLYTSDFEGDSDASGG